MILPSRNFETQTGLVVDIQHRDERDGNDARTLFLAIDGECYALTKSDAMRIADQLHAFAREMREVSCACGGHWVAGAFVHAETCDR